MFTNNVGLLLTVNSVVPNYCKVIKVIVTLYHDQKS